ncbi:MAG: lysophospholipid acyltransferase family protein [Deferribacterales bacterium]
MIIFYALYSVFVWFVVIFLTVFLVTLGLFPLMVGKNAYLTLARIWAKGIMLSCCASTKIEGMEKLDPDKNYVFMGNHQSYADIFFLLSIMDKRFLFMAKEELFKIPVFGFAIKSIGLIPINRGESRDALKSLFEAARKIQEGYSVLLFPEGTRSADGEMLPFKRGAFTLAVRTGHNIAPFMLEGTMDVLPKGSFIFKPFRKIRIRFLDTVSPEGLKDRELLDMIRERMEHEQKELRDSRAG